MSYNRITFKERLEIFKLLYVERKKPSAIAKILNRSASTISREINKGTESGDYNPFEREFLHLKARRYQCPHLKIDKESWKYIKSKLELRWSPKEIAYWLKEEHPEHSMCGKTIYNFIHFHLRGELKKLAIKDLRRRGKKRKSSGIEEKRGKISGMTLIDERPPEVAAREIPGHWEGDLIIGKDHQSAICVILERKTRYIQLDLLTTYDAQTVRKTIEKRFKRMEPELRKTLTIDQGKENSEHELLAKNAQIGVYFCHPHSPWEKGTCENTNGLIRDMLYPETDFRKLTQRNISRIARLLNERPRETLNWKTPKKAFNDLR